MSDREETPAKMVDNGKKDTSTPAGDNPSARFQRPPAPPPQPLRLIKETADGTEDEFDSISANNLNDSR